MIPPGRLAFPAFLLAALAALFAVLLFAPWAAQAQTEPTLQVEDVSASEGAGSLEFTVSLADGAPATQVATVDYATADGTATAGQDYTETSGTLTIPTGASSGVISVPVNNDRVPEYDETFTLTLSNPSNAVLPGGASSFTVTGTIIDNDKPMVTITLRQDEVFVGQPAVFDFTRAGSATDRLLIPFRVSIVDLDNVVIPGARYDNWSPSFITPNVVIPANETSVEWSWHPEDGIGEDYLVHMSPITAPDLFDVGIEEDYFTLTVRHRPVFVSSSPPDGLPAITITASSEDGVPTVAEGEDATFTLTRTGDTMEALTVHVRTEEPYHPGWNPRDPFNPTVKIHPVTFTTGTATATLDVAIDDDDVPESADWLEAQVSPPVGGNYSKGDPYRASVNIIDERVDHDSLSGLVEVGIVAATSSVMEGEPVRVDTVRPEFPDDGRDYPPLNVKVHISQDGAGIPEERLGIIASVHPWYAFRGVNRLGFPTLTNDGREPPTTVTFTILESPEYRIDPARASVTVTVSDRDPLPVLEIADSTAHRGAESIDFQVSYADGLPSYQTVTVDYATSDGTATAGQEYTAATDTLTIPPGETGGVITVQLNPADNQDADLDFSLTLTTPAYATFAEAATSASATGTINHRPGVSIRARQSEVLEGETALFELRRSGTPSSELTVTVFTQEPNHPEDSFTTRLHPVIFPTGSSTAILQVTADHDGVEEDEGDFLEAEIAAEGPPGEDEYLRKDPYRDTVEIRDLLADITIAADQETIDEGDIDEEVGSVDATFTLTRASTTANALTVTVRVDDPEMIRCFDHVFWNTYCPGRRATFEEEVTFAEATATATLAVKIYNDWRDVPDNSALTVTVIDGEGYRPGNPDSASVTLVDDDDTSVLILSTSHDEITEGNTLTCTVTRYGDISYYREQFPLEISGTGRGRSADEYITVELAAGVDRYTYTFDLEDDGKFDGDWTQTCRIDWIDLYVPLEQERQYFVVIGPRSITVPVRDAGGSHVTIAAGQTGITEGESAAFTLTRAGDTSEALAVRVSVEDPGDFMRGNGYWADPQPPTTVEFDAGSATATLSLPTRDDSRDIPDGDLTVTIEPGDHRDYRPGATSSASVTVRDNDTKPVIELSVNKETLTEGETVVFTLTRTVDFTHDVEMPLDVVIQGELKRDVVVFSPEHTVLRIEHETEDDDLDAADAVYRMTAVDPDNDYRTVAEPHTVAATVLDNDLPRVSIEASSAAVSEGEYYAFYVFREGQTTEPLPVNLNVSQTGAAIDEDYTGARTQSISRGHNRVRIGMSSLTGDGDEPDQSVTFEVLEGEGYVIDPGKSTATVTVIDTDPEPVLRVSRANDSHIVSEGAGAVEFTVSYEGPASQKEVTVDYYTLSGTATAGVDYTATSGTLTFADGETGGVISVPVIQDSRPEHDETFFLVMSNPGNARLEDGAQSVAALATIEDDEPRVSIDAVADEVTEGEPAVFNLTRTGDLTDELFVSLLVMEERAGSESNPLFPMTATFPADTSTVQVTHPTVDDDVDAQPFLVIALVRDLAALARTSTYVPLKYVASVTVQDDELPTVTIEAAEDLRVENEDAEFTLTRRGDLTDPLTVNLDGTPPSTATFAAGDSETTLTVAVDNDNEAEVHGSITAAISPGDYIVGNPGSATVEIADNDRAYTTVLSIAGNGPVTEGEDVVFIITRTGGTHLDLVVPVTLVHVWHSAGQPDYSGGEILQFSEETVQASFEPGDTAATLTIPTENETLNDGNNFVKATIPLSSNYGIDQDSPLAVVWVRDDDIPTVTVTPATQVHIELDPYDFEDPSTWDLAPRYTLHRTGDTSTLLRVDLRPPWVKHYTWGIEASTSYSNTTDIWDSRYIDRDQSNREWVVLLTRVPPLGGEGWIYLEPRFCPDVTDERCGVRPQYLVGEESTHYTKMYSNFMVVNLETDQSSVVEGQPATFTLNRYGGSPDNRWNPLTVRVEVTQDGEYIKGVPPQEVTFRGFPDTSVEDAEQTITLSIPTDDDMVDEAHGTVTVRILPPVDLSTTNLSYEIENNTERLASQAVTVQVTDNDYDPPPISISDARAGESDGLMEFFVTVAPSEREMSVNWTTVTETGVGVATADTDYDRASGKLTFAVGETTKTITVDVLDDDLNETDETFRVVLSGQLNASLGKNSGTGTIEDDDEGTVVTIHPLGPRGGTEEGQPAKFILQRVGGTGAIYVDLEISQEGEFLWSLQPAKISPQIPAGVNELAVEITTIDDNMVEANGSVTATVKATRDYYSPGKPDAATLNIRDNDRTISIEDVEAGEGQGEMTFTVTLSAAPSTEEVSVDMYTSPGTATSGDVITETSLGRDFDPKTERLVFDVGETRKSFTVTIVDDDIDESSEDFMVKLSNPSSNLWLTDASATGTIEDDDGRMEALISRETKRVDENEGTVVFAVDLVHDDTVGSERDTKLFWKVTEGTATEGADYVKPYGQDRGTLDIPVGYLTGSIEVDLIDDDLLEDRFETFTVELVEARHLALPGNEGDKKVEIKIRDDERLNPAVTARSDYIIEGNNAVFDVALSDVQTTQDTELEYTVSGTADSGDDYTAPSGTLTMPAGSDTGTITIMTTSDAVHDPGETLVVTLTSAESGDRDDVRFAGRVARVTILDPGNVTASVAQAEVEEGGRLYFDVTLSQASEDDVAVLWETSDDAEASAAATADVDYLKNSGIVIVPAGETSAVISVQTLEDTVAAEGDETFLLDLTAARTGFGPQAANLPLGVASALGTILDDDGAPTRIGLTATPDQVNENSGATSLTVAAALEGQHSLANDTLVQLALEDGTAITSEDYEAGTARLTIPAGAMTHTASLTLTPVDDRIFEGDETVSVTGTADNFSATPDEVTITDDDTRPTGVTLTLEPDVIGEGAGETALVVSATLTGGSALPEETRVVLSVEGVSLTLDDGATPTIETTAADADDFAADAVTLTIPARQTVGSATLSFTPVDDTLFEGNETAQVTGAAEGLTVTPAELTIEDNDREPTRIALSVSPAEVTEGEGDITLTVTATLEGGGARISGTEVSLSIQGLTATAGADFTAQEDVTLTIPAGQLSHTADLTLTPVDDNVAEGTEQLAVRGSNTEPGLPVSRARVTLADNDAQPTAIMLSLDRNTVDENGGAQRLTVTAVLEGDSRRTVDTSVRLTLAGKTAAESDYSALTRVLTIKAGESEGTATVVIVPTDDHIDEDDETLEVQGSTSGSRSGPALAVSGVVVTIRDDDTAGVSVTPTELFVVEGGSGSYRVALGTQPSADVKVTVAGHAGTNITLSGDWLTNDALTFTPDNWSTAQTVTVTAVQDDDATAPPDVTLTHTVSGTGEYAGVIAADVVVSITEDDEPGVTVSESALSIDEGATGSYTVKLDTEPTGDVTVAVAGHAGTDISLDKTSLTFNASSWDTAQTVTVTAGEDDDAASDAAVTLTHTANGGGYVDVRETVAVTIVEKDASVLSVEAAQAAEDGGNVVFTVSISAASGQEVTVDYATSGVTATAGQDYTETTGTLTFAANSVASQTVSVPVADDAVDEEEEETFTLTLSNVQGASLTGGESTLTVTGTITDDDDPAVTASFKQSSYSVDEGSTVEVTVTLSADPEREVAVQLTHDPQGGAGSADYSGVPESLVFQIGDTEKSFTFTAAADDIDDDGESVALSFGTTPDGVTPGTTATVTITDDDAAGVTVSETALNIDEGGSSSYTVVLDSQPTDDVTVAIAGHADTDITLSGDTLTNDTLTFTPDNWGTAQTVTVTAAQDDDAASDADVTLTHTANGGGYVDAKETVTVTIVEKDTSVLSVGDAQAAEDGGNVVFTVSISAASGQEVTVGYATSGVTATAGQDYTETTGTLTFAANSVASQTISVPVTDDSVDEAEEETFTLTLSNAQGASLAGGESTLAVTGTITDNDDPAVTASFGQASYSVAEGSTVEVTVTLSADPEREVHHPADPRPPGRRWLRRLQRCP